MCAHEINFHEINSHVVNSYKINSSWNQLLPSLNHHWGNEEVDFVRVALIKVDLIDLVRVDHMGVDLV